MITEKAENCPIIFFVDKKNKIDKIKLLCQIKSIAFYQIREDHQVKSIRACIRHLSKGVFVALEKYGRGTDLRFDRNSYVVIAFSPDRMDHVQQMIGRSSRTMEAH